MLSLNRYSLEATRSGNTINLVSNDVQKIEKSLNQLGMVFSAPMELSISLGILWYFIGWEALIGATVFFVLVAFQILLARKAADLRKKAATFTDERLMVMNEIIAGIRAVKMFAWEWNFIDGGRILNRFSKDVGTIDDVLPIRFLESVTMCLFSLLSFLVPAVTNYWLFLALLPILSIFMYYARYYLASSRELKRIEAIKCSPVYSHFTETIHGLEIIHISNKNKAFLERLERLVERAICFVLFCFIFCGELYSN